MRFSGLAAVALTLVLGGCSKYERMQVAAPVLLEPSACDALVGANRPSVLVAIDDPTGIEGLALELWSATDCAQEPKGAMLPGYPKRVDATTLTRFEIPPLEPDHWYAFRVVSEPADGFRSASVEGWFHTGAADRWSLMAAGAGHDCGTHGDGRLYCWGANESAQVGDGSVEPSDAPRLVVGGEEAWRSVTTGYFHTCAIREDGTLHCWGGDGGQRGTGGPDIDETPVQLGTGSYWSSVSAAYFFTCALRGTGALYCWGRNASEDGELAQVGTDTDWSSIACGGRGCCGIKTSGELYCWSGTEGAAEDAGVNMRVPARVGTSSDWRSVTVGNGHSCAITIDGALYCWGVNQEGQLGDGSLLEADEPLRIGTDTYWRDVSAGYWHTCATTQHGTLRCWGDNELGQLGDATSEDHATPRNVAGNQAWASVVAGHWHTCASESDGTVYCWGTPGAYANYVPFMSEAPEPIPEADDE